ncbi:hypothetical protein Peur_030129 [Populus x canadensis]
MVKKHQTMASVPKRTSHWRKLWSFYRVKMLVDPANLRANRKSKKLLRLGRVELVNSKYTESFLANTLTQ